ncbi:hypothetical protein LTR62_000032 [Meristemomyces frigidus]|uniref:Copper homeostasis protein cutC homolog n=1 Tax=Meristemomyces frigidus TaxID=1508187 RepID=A0AAN7TIH4_9PEZI|nr:hypothetical protein LTR62_000032 [Meristemomyces frigidus]
MALLEVACFSPEGAILAYDAGADRIELCYDRNSGGTTPPHTWLAALRPRIGIPIYVMIRPRPGNFIYTDAEFEQMRADLGALKGRVDGFVLGVLNAQSKVDVQRTAELVKLASPLPCTFHKAFDETPDLVAALEDVVETGCSSVLSSGGSSSALAGVDTLSQLVRMSQQRITVIPGGSLRASNVATIRARTQATLYHSSGIPKGAEEPSVNEIHKMKALLNDNTALTAGRSDSPSPSASRSSDDESPAAHMINSAVSVGPGQSTIASNVETVLTTLQGPPVGQGICD